MSNKLLILALILGLSLSLGLVFACGDDDDDDDDTLVDDDTLADDDADDDAALTCADAVEFIYVTCEISFEDYTQEDVTAWCDADDVPDWFDATIQCALDNYGDCDAFIDCYNAI